MADFKVFFFDSTYLPRIKVKNWETNPFLVVELQCNLPQDQLRHGYLLNIY